MDFRQIKAIEQANKNKLIKYFGNIPECSGIYILTREENGFKYAYVGQAKHILTRLAQHLGSHKQHIDNSLYKHKLYSEDNITGYKLQYVLFGIDNLDLLEQGYIKDYANCGYQMLNKTAGGVKDSFGIAEQKAPKGYHDGLEQGRKNLKKELNHIIGKYLNVGLKTDNKLSQNAMEKFNRLLGD